MSNFKKIKLDFLHDEEILQITLSAPKGNVLDGDMMVELAQAILHEGQKTSIKAFVFQGEGEHFSFGASVPEHQKEYVTDMLANFHRLMRTLIKLSKPMFALVRGQCLGGGLELAAFCHWIFAAEDAIFGQPEVKLAVFPPVASLILPHRVGQSAADDLVLSGRSISAQEAKQLGLVYSVSPDPQNELHEFISKYILPKSAVALQFTVKSSRHEMYQSFLQNIDAVEKMYVRELMETDDATEGLQAFMEKRRPIWKNC